MDQLDFGCDSDAVIRSDRLQPSQSMPFRPQDCIDHGFTQVAVIDLQALFCNDHVVIQIATLFGKGPITGLRLVRGLSITLGSHNGIS